MISLPANPRPIYGLLVLALKNWPVVQVIHFWKLVFQSVLIGTTAQKSADDFVGWSISWLFKVDPFWAKLDFFPYLWFSGSFHPWSYQWLGLFPSPCQRLLLTYWPSKFIFSPEVLVFIDRFGLFHSYKVYIKKAGFHIWQLRNNNSFCPTQRPSDGPVAIQLKWDGNLHRFF